MSTAGAPTIVLAGFPMHRIKDADPYQDTLLKIKTIAPVTGHVLDTATGLGYTAIQAAKTAESVTTIELDRALLAVARLNSWSQGLFTNPKITQIVSDSYEEVQQFPDHSFSRVIQDPPTLSLAGELQSAEFYRQLLRVLRPGGRLFHCAGNLENRLGRGVVKGVARRLEEGGSRLHAHRAQARNLQSGRPRVAPFLARLGLVVSTGKRFLF